MKKWKTALIITLSVIVISLFLFFFPPDRVLSHIPILKSFYQNTTLEIATPYGKSSVKINGKEYGETPLNVQSLVAGEYEVEITKISQTEGFYRPQTFKILVTKNSISRINMEIGPDDNLYGTILYYTQNSVTNRGKGTVTITSNATDSKVHMNKEFLKSTPITNLETNVGEYNLSITAKDYVDIEFPIIIREGYTLNVKTYLLPIPVNFENATLDE
jgi:hypothetical protein